VAGYTKVQSDRPFINEEGEGIPKNPRGGGRKMLTLGKLCLKSWGKKKAAKDKRGRNVSHNPNHAVVTNLRLSADTPLHHNTKEYSHEKKDLTANKRGPVKNRKKDTETCNGVLDAETDKPKKIQDETSASAPNSEKTGRNNINNK